MTSKDPCGVLSELPYSCDTFLRAVIENHRGGQSQCVHSSLEENESLYGMSVCLHKYA